MIARQSENPVIRVQSAESQLYVQYILGTHVCSTRRNGWPIGFLVLQVPFSRTSDPMAPQASSVGNIEGAPASQPRKGVWMDGLAVIRSKKGIPQNLDEQVSKPQSAYIVTLVS
jgi:hypothetical protein